MNLFNKLLVLAVALGFLIPNPGIMLKDYILVPLAVSVLFSLLASNQKFRLDLNAMRTGLAFNYGVLMVGLIAFAMLMPPGIKEGIILYAIFPPAISTMALAAQWGGKIEDVFIFQIASYAISLVFVPLTAIALIGKGVDPLVLALYIVAAFLVPAAASFAIKTKNKKLMSELAGIFIAVVTYMVIAKSQAWIIANWQSMLIYAIPLAIVCFALGYAAHVFSKDPDAVAYSILKNGGAAAAASIAILPEAATAIISAKVIIDSVLMVTFSKLMEKK